ncbi:MAG TPA: LysE family translocator [Candidatus Hydrogenedentes bacterium]|jgi:threonine/homoserine/homoserine lactone efflux protein|nr:LysE family translocator [Candidatus Hydrogenedentota bacterium]
MIAAFVTGIVLGLPAGLSPGPFFALVVAQSLRHGAREGIKVALAPLLTDAPIVLISVLAVSRLSHFEVLLGTITLAGSIYVAWLANECFHASGIDTASEPAAPDSLRKGIVVNFLNPHPYLFWLTVGAPLILKGWGENPFAAVSFLASFYTCLVGAKSLIAVGTARSRRLFTGKTYLWIMRLLGALLFLFALLLLWNAFEFFTAVKSHA